MTTTTPSDPSSGAEQPKKPTRARKPAAAAAERRAREAGSHQGGGQAEGNCRTQGRRGSRCTGEARRQARAGQEPAPRHRSPPRHRWRRTCPPRCPRSIRPPPWSEAVVEQAPAGPPPGPSSDDYEKLIGGDTHDPHGILGAHPQGDGTTVVRTLRHHAQGVTLLQDGKEIPFEHTHGGVFSAVIDGPVGDYRLRVDYGPGAVYEVDDPYRWLPTLGEIDLHLIGEGRHENLWEVLGAHVRTYDTPGGPVTGTSFAVWAPNARGVRVTGDFDHWSGAGTPMRSLGSSGVWELFVPGHRRRHPLQVPDPRAGRRLAGEGRPVGVRRRGPAGHRVRWSPPPHHEWDDADWMASRAQTDQLNGPLSIYEIHAGSWKMGLDYRQMADELIADLAETGFTHVEFLPLAGHPFAPSWGYQVTSYYAPDSRFGSPDDLRYLIDRLHQAGIGVILDWVPAHFPKDEWALGQFDGTSLYEHADPRRGEQPDWGTFVFDFGRREVRNFLVANALYWLEQYHVDGLRVDAVASMLYLDYSREDGQWLPNIYGGNENLDAVAFLQETNATVGKRVPGVADDRRGIDRVAGRHPADASGRARVPPEVEHGLDARQPGLHLPGPDLPVVAPQRDDVLADVRLLRAVRAADLARRGGARQGLAVVEDPR